MIARVWGLLAGSLFLLLSATTLGQESTEPVHLFDAFGAEVLIDASGEVFFEGQRLAVEGQPVRRAVGAVELGGHLLVAIRDGAILVFEPSGTDDLPRLVQVLDGLGRELRAIEVDGRLGRAILLAAGTTELFGVHVHDEEVWREDDPTRRAFVDHARFLEVLRDDEGGETSAADARTFAIGPRSILLATDRGLLELLHLNRSYAVLARASLPEGVARIESLAFAPDAGNQDSVDPRNATGRWLLAGLSSEAECVLKWAEHPAGPWQDLGVATLDAALAGESEPIAWLPGGFTVAEGVATLCIRGERGAAVSWDAGATSLNDKALTIRWLDDKDADDSKADKAEAVDASR
ncbi:MAG: hypothetical protein RIE77_10140 [Phycisphaerales bacterium]|jgi:hypothetical protein